MFYGTGGRWYLSALACHQEIFNRGLSSGISHFQCESYYKALMSVSADKHLGRTAHCVRRCAKFINDQDVMTVIMTVMMTNDDNMT